MILNTQILGTVVAWATVLTVSGFIVAVALLA